MQLNSFWSPALANGTALWLGLDRVAGDGGVAWHDGTSALYQNWAEEGVGSNDSAIMAPGGAWHWISGEERHLTVCRKLEGEREGIYIR